MPQGPSGPQVALTGSDLTTRQWLISFALVTSLFFTWGFSYGLLDVLNKHFQEIFGITTTKSTLLQAAYFGAYLVFAPFAGVFMRRFGYKKGIHMGLTLYSVGAVLFWPCAKFGSYGGFVACTFVIGCGLGTLEVAANSYISILGSAEHAASRLMLSQGFQGVASFTGPLIASKYFFSGEHQNNLDTVQWVYLAVAGLGLVLNLLFVYCPLPEIHQEVVDESLMDPSKIRPFWKQYHTLFGFVAQMAYVGAQVGVASFVVNFLTENTFGHYMSNSEASRMFSYCQVTFTVARFASAPLLHVIDPALMLSVYGLGCVVFSIVAATAPGNAGVAALFLVFFFESICYPVIFTLGTKNLGVHAKRGSSLIVMGVGGGAWYPAAQGALADRATKHRSYLVPMTGFITMTIYAVGIVISQTIRDGFRVRNVAEVDVIKEGHIEAVPVAEQKFAEELKETVHERTSIEKLETPTDEGGRLTESGSVKTKS